MTEDSNFWMSAQIIIYESITPSRTRGAGIGPVSTGVGLLRPRWISSRRTLGRDKTRYRGSWSRAPPNLTMSSLACNYRVYIIDGGTKTSSGSRSLLDGSLQETGMISTSRSEEHWLCHCGTLQSRYRPTIFLPMDPSTQRSRAQRSRALLDGDS